MKDLLTGLVFVALLVAPVVAATLQRSGSDKNNDQS